MIKSFSHKGLEKFYLTGSKAGITPAHASKIQDQLTVLEIASRPDDIDRPGWSLHPLHGALQGHWSIRVNGNWRLTFRFIGEDVEGLDYQDYH